jgi:hypothetical protein
MTAPLNFIKYTNWFKSCSGGHTEGETNRIMISQALFSFFKWSGQTTKNHNQDKRPSPRESNQGLHQYERSLTINRDFAWYTSSVKAKNVRSFTYIPHMGLRFCSLVTWTNLSALHAHSHSMLVICHCQRLSSHVFSKGQNITWWIVSTVKSVDI